MRALVQIPRAGASLSMVAHICHPLVPKARKEVHTGGSLEALGSASLRFYIEWMVRRGT